MTTPLVAAIVAFVASASVVGVLASARFRHLLLDRPGHRSLHTLPTPRSGGLGIAAGVAAGVSAGLADLAGWWIPVASGWAFVIAVSLVDDWRGLPAWLRLPFHLAASALVALSMLEAHGWMLVLAVVAMCWVTNLFNFMDGSDGLAAGMATFGFGTYAVAGTLAGDASLATFSAVAAAASAGFLLHNFPPARIFMGDAGSIALGFLAGALGVVGYVRHDWSPLFPAVTFAPFVLDATLTLGKRALRGERVWEAHREHAYQKLNMLGLGHRRTALAYYVAMAACSLVALRWFRAVDLGKVAAAGSGLTASLIAIYFIVDRLWRSRLNRTA